MHGHSLTELQRLKIKLLAEGIRIDASAEHQLSDGGRVPLTIHEYATTGGVTLILGDDLYVNAPFDDWYCAGATALLRFDREGGTYVVSYPGGEVPARAIPLPGYLDACDQSGRKVRDTAMSHADRVRLSPIDGCAFTCRFCDLGPKQYALRPAEQIVESLDIAKRDTNLPAKHVLISGGTPGRRHESYFDDVVSCVVAHSDLPVDVMMTPRLDVTYVERYSSAGVFGFSLNLEVYADDAAQRIIPEKQRLGREVFAQNVERAVTATGRNGRVRSLIIVGLEEPEATLKGVEWIASLGADPVLSPFRPAQGTAMENEEPPTVALLERVYAEAHEISDRHGVRLGPRCIPCQHNTLSFPDDSGSYYYS